MKHVQNSSVQTSNYRDLPLSQLQESPTNPRKYYNEERLQELAESIRAQGVLAPLIVREIGKERFEIVVGSRRFRAAQRADLQTIPVRIAAMTDQRACEVQSVENLQREDVHPLEEAEALRQLIEQGYDFARIGEKIGKSPSYIAQRLQLTQLIPPIAQEFLEGKLTVGHASLIAKLPPAQQPEAFTAAFRNVYLTSGQTSLLVPVRELAVWIEANLLLELSGVPFDRSDTSLLAEAGSCDSCPKRTGFNALLFPDSSSDRCTDRTCFHAKIDAHLDQIGKANPALIQISTAWNPQAKNVLSRGRYIVIDLRKKGKRNADSPGSRKCAHLSKAIVVEGSERGHVLTVCAERSCPVHHAEDTKHRETREKLRAEQRKQEDKRKREFSLRQRILAAILKEVKEPLSNADVELVASTMWKHLPHQYQTIFAKRHEVVDRKGGAKSSRGEALAKQLVETALLEAVYNPYSTEGGALLKAVAKRHRVDVEQIVKTMNTERAQSKKNRSGTTPLTAKPKQAA